MVEEVKGEIQHEFATREYVENWLTEKQIPFKVSLAHVH